jgi:hypothetical protein
LLKLAYPSFFVSKSCFNRLSLVACFNPSFFLLVEEILTNSQYRHFEFVFCRSVVRCPPSAAGVRRGASSFLGDLGMNLLTPPLVGNRLSTSHHNQDSTNHLVGSQQLVSEQTD